MKEGEREMEDRQGRISYIPKGVARGEIESEKKQANGVCYVGGTASLKKS